MIPGSVVISIEISRVTRMCDLPDGSNIDHPTTERDPRMLMRVVSFVRIFELSGWREDTQRFAVVNAALSFRRTGGRKSGSISSAHVGSPALNEYHSGAAQC